MQMTNQVRVQIYADGSQRAPIHLVIGHAGAGLSFTVQFEKPEIFEVVKIEHGYMRVEANGTSLICEVRHFSTFSICKYSLVNRS